MPKTGTDPNFCSQAAVTPEPSPEDLALLRGPVARLIAENYPDVAQRVWGIKEKTG